MPIADYYPRYRGGLLDDIQMFRLRSTNRVTHVQLRHHTPFAEEAFLKVTRSLAAGLSGSISPQCAALEWLCRRPMNHLTCSREAFARDFGILA